MLACVCPSIIACASSSIFVVSAFPTYGVSVDSDEIEEIEDDSSEESSFKSGCTTSEDECGSSEVTEGCDLPSNNVYVYNGSILYNSDYDIAGFQFQLEGVTLSGTSAASGGNAVAAGFTLTTNSGGTVLGFSFTGLTISAGCGTLLNLDIVDGEVTGMSDIVISNSAAQSLNFEYYAGPGMSL
jgi:hypothetical protein